VNDDRQAFWLAGAGVEWAFGYNWTVKLEYDYLGLSDRTVFTPQTSFLAGDIFTNTGNNGNNNIQMVKLGINYLFNWGSPVVARY
jgi:outer membrane immunogenic protein